MNYNKLSNEIIEKIKNDNYDKFKNYDNAIRRDPSHDVANIWRPCYVRDIEKILYCPYYNRYSDKTQVFSFYKNDDITRRGLHVQLVSRIARNIGKMLDLDLDLIEAISIGHDIGHTPFGHAGEDILNNIYNYHTGRYFMHNIQSIRVLDKIFNYNISLQTLDGILCHNGEVELEKYQPAPLTDFNCFDETTEKCSVIKDYSLKLIPATLEGCVVRISDIIAYLGKDRQDASLAGIDIDEKNYNDGTIGNFNAQIINNLIVNIVENSYKKGYIALEESYYNDLKKAKEENYSLIYKNKKVKELRNSIEPMFEAIYNKCLFDLENKNTSSFIFTHHLDYIAQKNKYKKNDYDKTTEKNQMVVDYIASMSDSYFSEFYSYICPDKKNIEYVSYF